MVNGRRRLSPNLLAELERAKAVYINIANSLPEYFPVQDGRRSRLLAAQLHIAHDLNASIIRLVSRGGSCDAGAFALLRPLLEVYISGMWISLCATDGNIARTWAGESVTPPLANMIEAVDKKIGHEILAQTKGNLKRLHSYTHCGFEQLARRFDNTGRIASSYTDEDKYYLLLQAAWIASQFSSYCCKLAQGPDSVSGKQIDDKFMEIFPNVNK